MSASLIKKGKDHKLSLPKKRLYQQVTAYHDNKWVAPLGMTAILEATVCQSHGLGTHVASPLNGLPVQLPLPFAP